jgi:SAM-dependent methyltransferase
MPYWQALHSSPELALHATLYTWAAGQFAPGRVLDLGCEFGFGDLLMDIANPQLQLTALDAELDNLRKVCELAPAQAARVVCAQAGALPFASGCFSGVCLINLLHLVDDPLRTLHEANRVLFPGGLAVIAIPRILSQQPDEVSPHLEQSLGYMANQTFAQVTVPKIIRGQPPTLAPQSFALGPDASLWVAIGKKG